jgi:hypothetical protein
MCLVMLVPLIEPSSPNCWHSSVLLIQSFFVKSEELV